MVEMCVVYLVWGPLGRDPIERFAASYSEHPAGLEHRLVMVLNGVKHGHMSAGCRSIGDRLGADCIALDRPVIDLDAYAISARELKSNRLCFLNTYSEIIAPGWLAALDAPLEHSEIGLAGATGSYESALTAAPRPLKPFLARKFPPFPNPHIRTNAFTIERQLMLALDWPPSPKKRRALELESGKCSITRQVWQRGLRAVVVGRDGQTYDRDEWQQSHTFRSGNQQNLLVADNRTRQYMDADADRRRELTTFAWGAATITARPPSPAPQE
jgi:hypothetical protein